MKQQIEKAAEEYALKFCTEKPDEMLRISADEIRCYFRDAFNNGANFANQIWEEKTRWIPVGERLPEIREVQYPIAAKYNEDSYAIFWIFKDCMPLSETMATHWKEII